MDRKLKIGLYSFGGLVVATGIFFGIRAIIKAQKAKREKDDLQRKEDLNELTTEERQRLNELEKKFELMDGEKTSDNMRVCAFPLGNNAGGNKGCKEVAQIQLAMNKKHLPGRGTEVWACNGTSQELVVDGQMGSKTMTAIARFYGFCCKSTGFLYEVCNCTKCSIDKSKLNQIIKGADVSDSALEAAGFDVYSSYSGFDGSGFLNFTLSDKEELRGEGGLQWRDQQGPLGDFFANRYDFTDDYPPVSNLEHAYGQGKGFGFNGYSNQVGNIRPDLGGGFSSFQNRMMNMGCNGLISRRDVLQSKLNRFDTLGIRPNQRIQLQEKIDFINSQLQQKNCDLMFSGMNEIV